MQSRPSRSADCPRTGPPRAQDHIQKPRGRFVLLVVRPTQTQISRPQTAQRELDENFPVGWSAFFSCHANKIPRTATRRTSSKQQIADRRANPPPPRPPTVPRAGKAGTVETGATLVIGGSQIRRKDAGVTLWRELRARAMPRGPEQSEGRP